MFFFRSLDENNTGDSGPKINSVSGANRKRKWKDEEEDEEEEEQKAEESSDVDTSSDDDDDDEEENEESNMTTETNESKEATPPSQEEKVEMKVEEQKEEDEKKNEKKVQIKRPSEPAIFIPVDRLPEIQVCLDFQTIDIVVFWFCRMYFFNVFITFPLQEARLKLPVLAEEQVIMEAVRENPCVVICGETGSGKTTQVPQFLYEAGYARYSVLFVIVKPLTAHQPGHVYLYLSRCVLMSISGLSLLQWKRNNWHH